MKKVLISGLLMLFTAAAAFAQLTEGVPTAKKIRTGNRAEAGDFGLYLGASSNMFKDAFDDDITISPLPLVNLKYMVTDQLEVRLGLEFSKKKETIKGDEFEGDISDATMEVKYKSVETDNRILPGFAYHFSRSNLLDVYAGAELPIGWVRNKLSGEVEDSYSSTTKTGFQIGLGAFIGLQVHIADLPLALGVEYGISSMFDGRLRYKNTYKDGGEEQVYYTPDLESFKKLNGMDFGRFDSLKARKGEIGNQFKITLTYYFK